MSVSLQAERKLSHQIEKKVASEYLAEKFEEILKKHFTEPAKPEKMEEKPEKLQGSSEETQQKPNKKPRVCPNTVPKKQQISQAKAAFPQQRLKSSSILSKTITVNKTNLTTYKGNSQKKSIKSRTLHDSQQDSSGLSKENLQKLGASSEQLNRRANGLEAASLQVNASETQSFSEDKPLTSLVNGNAENGEEKASVFNRKNVEDEKKRAKSQENACKTDAQDAGERKGVPHEVIVEDPHEESRMEKGGERELEKAEEELNVKVESLEEKDFEKIKSLDNPDEYTKKVLIAFIGFFAGSHESLSPEILKKTEFSFPELVHMISSSAIIISLVKNVKNLIETKAITDNNVFYSLETLNKSYICLDNVTNTNSIEEMSHMSLFLQKAIEYYKLYKNFLINEKIKKLNVVQDANSNENEPDVLQIQPEKPEKIEPDAENKEINGNENKKSSEISSKVKEFIANGGAKEKKIDDLEKMRKEILQIKDQNSKLRWEIERDRKKMERINDLQTIQKELNQNFEMEKKFKEYLKQKEKNEKEYLISIKKDTIDSIKTKKEIETKTKKIIEKEIVEQILHDKQWKQKQEEQKKKEKNAQTKDKIDEIQEKREIKKKIAQEEKEKLKKDIGNPNESPQRAYEKEFKELIKKKNELKKEYEANLNYLSQAHNESNGASLKKSPLK